MLRGGRTFKRQGLLGGSEVIRDVASPSLFLISGPLSLPALLQALNTRANESWLRPVELWAKMHLSSLYTDLSQASATATGN